MGQKGNQFWKQRTKHGRDRIISDPDTLWDAACGYFQWCEDNPLQEAKVVNGKIEELPKLRAMTQSALCFYLGISEETYRCLKDVEGFSGVKERIDSALREQKFSGAAAGLLKENIIARELGLKDKSSNEITGQDGGPLLVGNLSNEELEAIINRGKAGLGTQGSSSAGAGETPE